MDPMIDGTDPLVVLLTWALTLVVGKLVKKGKFSKLRHMLPAFAVLGAVAIRAIIEASQGAELTVDTALRALAAGGVAVMGHSQIREIQKAMTSGGGDDAVSAAPTEPPAEPRTAPEEPPEEPEEDPDEPTDPPEDDDQ
jgi:hypothetical protein